MKHHWRYDKILDLETVAKKAEEFKEAGKKLTTVNGAFDILHAGHLDMLEEAKQQGDILFVGLNSDTSIRGEKGAGRPYISQQERAALLAALACTDYVVIIDGPYSKAQDILIETVKPHVHANGAEYGPPENWVEWPVMRAVGATGHAVARRPGLATTNLIKKIQNSSSEKSNLK